MTNYESLRHLLRGFAGQNNVLTCPRPFIDFMGSLEGGVFLAQVIFWSDRGSDPDWFYKTHDEWEEETSLNQYKVRKYVAQLEKMELLSTEFRKPAGYEYPVWHYHFDWEAFADAFLSFLEDGGKGCGKPEGAKFRPSKISPPDLAKIKRTTLQKSQGPYIRKQIPLADPTDKANETTARRARDPGPVEKPAQPLGQGELGDAPRDRPPTPNPLPPDELREELAAWNQTLKARFGEGELDEMAAAARRDGLDLAALRDRIYQAEGRAENPPGWVKYSLLEGIPRPPLAPVKRATRPAGRARDRPGDPQLASAADRLRNEFRDALRGDEPSRSE